jgi:hypothetical protein
METKVIKTYGISQESYIPIQTEFEGKQYMVVPVVMMVEGVHSGSRGPLLHLAEELGRVVEAWNGIPITLQHPQNENVFISANSPQTLTQYYIGRVFNTQMDGSKLKAEAWFDIQALAAKSPESLAKIQAGEVMEVSVGVFSEEDTEEGEYNNEQYVAIARNLRPDHLALLPGQTGACSVNDGCGLRVNKKGGTNVIEINHDLLKEVSAKNHTVISFTGNSTGLMETVDKVREALYTRDSNLEYYYLEDVFSGYVIYRKRVRQETSEGVYSETSNDLWKESYSIVDGVVSFMNDPVKVARKIEYPIINIKKEVKMCEKCPEKVNALIAHTSTHFDESDRDWLGALTEDKLDKLIPKVMQANTSAPSLEDAWKVINTNAKSIEDYTSKLPESIKAQVETGLNAYKEMRNGINTNIIANTDEGTWSEDELNAMSLETLQKLEKSVIKSGDFSVQGVSSYKSSDGTVIAPMLPNFGTESDK